MSEKPKSAGAPDAAVPVYFADNRSLTAKTSKIKKIEKLFAKAGFDKLFAKDDLAAVKLHFGERGNDTFLKPMFARTVVDKILARGAKPFLTDTNTLYKGSRHNAVDHLHTALEHGYSFATVGAPLIIADGLQGHYSKKIKINKKHFKEITLAGTIAEADAMLVLSHFKGHILAGVGGAMKNLAMGCAPSSGKCDQHSSRFNVKPEKCVACGMCIANCPKNAISWKKDGEKKHACIDMEACIGCGECLTVCQARAIEVDFATEIPGFVERLVEYAYGAAASKKGKIGYINFVMDITPDCDCAAWSDTPIVPDIGILASSDPVALDKACYDLVNAQVGLKNTQLACNHEVGKDKFKGVWAYTLGENQFSYAEAIGLGSCNYKLVKI